MEERTLVLNSSAMRIINAKLDSLSKSKFRSGFYLRKKEIEYVDKYGMKKISAHAYDFIKNKLAPAYPYNDGAQTPMKNHPVFIAQHATGTCCRGCLEKWHKIPKGVELTDNQINYVVAIIMEWIKINYRKL
jgi:exodeoxyribonuclease V alpha subunit